MIRRLIGAVLYGLGAELDSWGARMHSFKAGSDSFGGKRGQLKGQRTIRTRQGNLGRKTYGIT
jgi:hypothetical protein